MADGVFNIAKGQVAAYHERVNNNDPSTATLKIVLLASTGLVGDATMKDYNTLSDILAGASDEATNTGYSRKTLSDTDIAAITVDDSSDVVTADTANQTWTSVSNDGTGAIGKLLVCYDAAGAGDGSIVPLTYHDFAVTPNGGDITATIANYFQAS